MKKFLSLLLTVALVATVMVMPVSAAAPTGAYLNVETGEYEADTGVVKDVYADINFDDAQLDLSQYVTTGEDGSVSLSITKGARVPVVTTNAATESDRVITITTAANADVTNTASEIPNKGLFYTPISVDTYENGSTNYAMGGANRKASAQFRVTVDKDVDGTITKAGVSGGENELVYFDFKMKRNYPTMDDNSTINITDEYGNTITSFYFTNNKDMRVSANGVNYGGDLTSNAPVDSSWMMYRMIMDFTTHTFKLYVGEDANSLKPYLNSVESYTMVMTNAVNLYKLEDAAKMSLSFDDIKIYTVKPPVAPVATDVTVAGKPNLGETLTMTYGSYSCEGDIAEGDSYCYWEASDDSTFVSATKLTDNIPVKAGETKEYVITEAATGKYVRCVVVPVNVAGIDGTKVYSNATAYKANDITATLSVSGNIKGGTNWDYKHNPNNYAGKVSFVSTLSSAKSYTLIAAWYVNETDAETGKKLQRLVSIKTLPVLVDAANTTETGAISASFTTDTVYSVPKGGDGNENTIKVMLFNDLQKITPVCTYVYAGTNF